MPVVPKQLSTFSQKELKQIIRSARRVLKDPGLDIILYPARLAFGRILVVTSRKVGNAPERNKIRRRLKAIFYQERLYEHKKDCIVFIKKPGIHYTYEQLKDILCTLFERHVDL